MPRLRKKAPRAEARALHLASANEVEARCLARMLARAKGFALGIAVANSPALRCEVVGQVKALSPGLVVGELELKGPVSSLLGAMEEDLAGRRPGALFVYGLERSLEGQPGYAPIFGNLNLTRNLFPERCPCPMVLWLPQFAFDRLARHAPDFFSWRSGTYFFVQEPVDLRAYAAEQLSDRSRFDNLTKEEKEDRIAALQDIYEGLKRLPEEPRILKEQVFVADALGGLSLALGRYAAAEKWYQKSLAIDRSLGNRAGEAISLHQLGILAQERGDLSEAERLYRESLEIARALGNRAGEARSLHQLGNLAYLRGDLAEAERLYRESLAIARALGDRGGEARSLHQLGNLAYLRGDLAEAERLYRESLGIKRALGDRRGEASSLHQLGRIAEERGDLSEAERLYRESLGIRRALGDRSGEAASLHQLGMLAEMRGDLVEAERLYRESLAIAEAIGVKEAETIRRSLARLQSLLKGQA